MIVYKVTNLINGKIYVGQTKRKGKRLENYLGSGLLIKQAVNKYGKENFKKEILETCINQEQLDSREKYLILQYNSLDKNIGYNIGPGGEGGDTTTNHPNKSAIIEKRNISIQNVRDKITASQKKYYSIEENRLKASILTKAGMTLEVRKKMSNKKKGVIWSEERKAQHKINMAKSEKHKAAIHNPERSKKIIATKKRNGTNKHSLETRDFLRNWNITRKPNTHVFTFKDSLNDIIYTGEGNKGVKNILNSINSNRKYFDRININKLLHLGFSKEFILLKREKYISYE